MPTMELIRILLFSAAASGVVCAQQTDATAHIRYESDVVQHVHSQALPNFALEHKYLFLTQAVRAECERHLNLATEVFRE